MPFVAELIENKVIISDPSALTELYESVWYGKTTDRGLELELVEACLLAERQRIEITKNGKKIDFKDFYNLCCALDTRFVPRYAVYRDLRERGLPVRVGFKGTDFKVYERGSKPSTAGEAKWIVFAESEDYPCEFAKLGKAIKLAQNIRALALWAIVDNDLDVTYYIISTPSV
ncbi:MAG: tRNA-intron lyase [Candidatus Aenigmatarchaeota archaeon]|nr:tRNA-intron lyase [Candidatus Aenigmarchaeota archaeon]